MSCGCGLVWSWVFEKMVKEVVLYGMRSLVVSDHEMLAENHHDPVVLVNFSITTWRQSHFIAVYC